MHKLAIVIPAYKSLYFERVMISLASQTCKDFQVYVGDDNSPEDIEKIVEKYENQLTIIYKKFDVNIGGKDLVAQWQRCIDLTKGEEWIWLFSDDDELDTACVEKFYETIEKEDYYDVFHFNVIPIDKYGNETTNRKFQKQSFPSLLYSKEFVRKRLKYKINSFVVEYIFRRESFLSCGGFQRFDMAWGADDATWAKLAAEKGIRTIEGAKVRWRYSGDNITSIESADIMRRKGRSVVELLTFYKKMYTDKSLNKWYYNYYLHMLYNVMKSCEWMDVKRIILMYKEEHTDLVPLLIWRFIHKIINLK